MAEANISNDEVRTRYELSFLVRSDGDHAKVSSVLSLHGAEITFQGPVNQIRLAYPIKREESAYFGFFQFTLSRTETAKIHEALNRESSVLRFLLIEALPEDVREVEKPISAPSAAPVPTAQPATPRAGITTNEALEKRLEEILK
ncbi:MAG: 30S ribosomal protein S6 [Patescibacteria group bacterium]